MNKIILIILLGFISWGMIPSTQESDLIIGHWISPNNDLIVRCYKDESGRYFGKIVWFKVYNQSDEEYDCDISQKDWINTVVLSNFTYKDKEWSGGEILNLQNCSTYDAYIQLQSPTQLKATGFIFFRWLSESVVFNKYTGDLPHQN